MSLVEGTDGYEAAALRYRLGPHAPATATKLLEGGLYAGVEDGVRLAVEREAPLEPGDLEVARAVGHEEGDGGAGVRVVQRVRPLYVTDGVET